MNEKSDRKDWTKNDLIDAAQNDRAEIYARLKKLALQDESHVAVAAMKLILEIGNDVKVPESLFKM